MNNLAEVNKVLLRNGILPNLKGYRYCLDILVIMKRGRVKMRECYEILSNKYGILPNSIEKSVVNAIEKAFGKSVVQKKYENLCVNDGKISNKKFFLLLLTELQERELVREVKNLK